MTLLPAKSQGCCYQDVVGEERTMKALPENQHPSDNDDDDDEEEDDFGDSSFGAIWC